MIAELATGYRIEYMLFQCWGATYLWVGEGPADESMHMQKPTNCLTLIQEWMLKQRKNPGHTSGHVTKGWGVCRYTVTRTMY